MLTLWCFSFLFVPSSYWVLLIDLYSRVSLLKDWEVLKHHEVLLWTVTVNIEAIYHKIECNIEGLDWCDDIWIIVWRKDLQVSLTFQGEIFDEVLKFDNKAEVLW